APANPMDTASRAYLVQIELAWSGRAKLRRGVLCDRSWRRADIRGKPRRPRFLQVTHDIQHAHPCSCQSGLSSPIDDSLAPLATPSDAPRLIEAMDRAVSGRRACSHNRRSRRRRSWTSVFSNFASRDATMARLRLEQTRSKVSCERFSTSNSQRSTSNVTIQIVERSVLGVGR